MNKCIICGDISGDYLFCYKCHNDNTNNFQKQQSNQNVLGGFSDYDYYRHYNMIKGRIAETIIEELFISMDWNVFRYGMENTVPGVMKLLTGVRSDVAQDIRRMPDFVVQDKNRNFYYIEVKFRANEEFSKTELEDDYPYENAYFIIVSKSHIKCISYKELMIGEIITNDANHYLYYRKEFNFSKMDEVKIKIFCKYAEKFFSNVNVKEMERV